MYVHVSRGTCTSTYTISPIGGRNAGLPTFALQSCCSLIAAGQSIGNYVVLSKIGTGGMGAVYLAEHPTIGKRVALKVIHRELAGNREVVQRFFQEAKAVNKIGSEHIVEIHDFGVTPDGDHFYIMEYLEGETLASLLSKHRVLDVMRALHIGAQVAAALGAAHACGIIHRDLKPDNVMLATRLGDRDFVKLLDFGLAKMFQSGQNAVKTAAGVLLGTPQYMSPEACESRPNLDNRTDIYALGVLLFQMMTGVLPFDGETMGEVLVKQVTQLPPAPRAINASIAPSVEQILLRCLAKAPDSRFPTMSQLRDALLDPEKYLGTSPPISPARSVAPGQAPVDAKTMIAFAAQQQAAGTVAQPAAQRTEIGTAGGYLPLAAPPPSVGHASGSQARTMIADSALVPPRQAPGPDLAAPTQPKMNTMRIATPLGYSSRPPRRMWPVVLVLGLLLGLGGGAFAVAWFGRKGSAVAGSVDGAASGGSAVNSGSAVKTGNATPGPGPGSAKVAPASGSATPPTMASGSASGSGSALPPATGSATPQVGSGSGSGNGSGNGSGSAPPAVVVIDSTPQGASVTYPGAAPGPAGKTPLRLTLPVSSQPIAFELELPGYKHKTKSVTISGNAVVLVDLERIPVITKTPPVAPQTGTKTKPPKGDNTNGLMRPEDM